MSKTATCNAEKARACKLAPLARTTLTGGRKPLDPGPCSECGALSGQPCSYVCRVPAYYNVRPTLDGMCAEGKALFKPCPGPGFVAINPAL